MPELTLEELEKIKEDLRKEIIEEKVEKSQKLRTLAEESVKIEEEKNLILVERVKTVGQQRLEATKKLQKAKRLSATVARKLAREDKANQFLIEFLNNGGNAAKAAMKISGTNSATKAMATGEVFLKRAKALARTYLEKQGLGYGKLLDIAAEKMQDSKTPEWWDRLMRLADYEDFLAKKPVQHQPQIVNVIQTHENLAKQFGFGEVIEGEEDGK
jgi:hypothetical protein